MRLLDLFCGAGGCSVGYHRAGFDVTGVDIQDLGHRYPYRFVNLSWDQVDLDGFDVVHASPPCQAYSITRNAHNSTHPELLEPVRARLQAWGGPYVIENVPGAPMPSAITVCGARLQAHDPNTGKRLRLRRHRLFESNVFLMAEPCSCDSVKVGGVYGHGNSSAERAKLVGAGYTPDSIETRRALMGIDWMNRDQLSQAIPPAYTEFIGEQLWTHLVDNARV